MKKTHKKVLGFAGLGLVAAVTTVAATIPAPIAAAIANSVTDEITVRVTEAAAPWIDVDPLSAETTDASYTIKVQYGNSSSAIATLVNLNDAGDVIYGPEVVWSSSEASGSAEIPLNFNNYGGYGNFYVTVRANNASGVFDEKTAIIKYTKADDGGDEDGGDVNPDPGTGDVDVDVDVPTEKVETITVIIRDKDGNIVKEVEVNDPSEVENIDLSDLGNGTYTMEVITKDKDGNPIGSSTTETVVIAKDNTDVEIENPDGETKKVVIVVKDEDGNVVKTIEVDDPGDGQKVNVDLSDLPAGNYTIETEYYDEDGNKTGTTTEETTVGKAGVDVEIENPEGDTKQVVIVVKDEDGNVVKEIVIDNPQDGADVYVDLSDLPAGEYTIDAEYYDQNGNKTDTKTTEVTKSDENGNVNVDVDTEVDVVTDIEVVIYDSKGDIVRVIKADRETGTVYVYDADGNLLFTIPNGYREDSELTIPMEGLDSDDYTATIMYRDENGKLIGGTKTYKIKYEEGSKPVIVPDTGSFFQGLNISREDYLITGLVVFAIVGVVAFGIVVRNRASKSSKGRR